jgi:hypothetical protein
MRLMQITLNIEPVCEVDGIFVALYLIFLVNVMIE